MQINTKLGIGQTAFWDGGENGPSVGQVKEIEITVNSDSSVNVLYMLTNIWGEFHFSERALKEKRLFLSAEDCRKHHRLKWKK